MERGCVRVYCISYARIAASVWVPASACIGFWYAI